MKSHFDFFLFLICFRIKKKKVTLNSWHFPKALWFIKDRTANSIISLTSQPQRLTHPQPPVVAALASSGRWHSPSATKGSFYSVLSPGGCHLMLDKLEYFTALPKLFHPTWLSCDQKTGSNLMLQLVGRGQGVGDVVAWCCEKGSICFSYSQKSHWGVDAFCAQPNIHLQLGSFRLCAQIQKLT